MYQSNCVLFEGKYTQFKLSKFKHLQFNEIFFYVFGTSVLSLSFFENIYFLVKSLLLQVAGVMFLKIILFRISN